MQSLVQIIDRAPLPPIALPFAIATFDHKKFFAHIERLASPGSAVDDDDHDKWWLIDPTGDHGGQMIRLDCPAYYLHLEDFDPATTLCSPAHPDGSVQVRYSNKPEDK